MYRGASSELLTSRVKYTKDTVNPTHVAVLSGEIDVREKKTAPEAIISHNNLIESVRTTYPNAKILGTSVPITVKSALLRQKINKLNDSIWQKCVNTHELTLVDCADLMLHIHIHISTSRKSKLACKAIDTM